MILAFDEIIRKQNPLYIKIMGVKLKRKLKSGPVIPAYALNKAVNNNMPTS